MSSLMNAGGADVRRPHYSPLVRLLHPFGIDRAVAYTLIGRGSSVAAGILTVGLIARFLRPEAQGFYYTFGSVVALYIFCEFGLTFVIVQFASHEMARLEWTPLRTLAGADIAKARLAALLARALKWYAAAALLVLLLVLPAGLLFFTWNSGAASAVTWRLPWVWLAIASVLNLSAAPFFAVLEGSGRISELALTRTGQNLCANVAVWVTLAAGGGLFAAAIFQTTYFAVGAIWLIRRYGRAFHDLLGTDFSRAPFDWRTEVWPFQWRIALSWISNYFIIQFFNPVLFASNGPAAAGQMGMSLSISTALLNASMSWMTTKVSPFGVLVARGQWKSLDALFFRTLTQSLMVLTAGGAVLCATVTVLHRTNQAVAHRILDPLPFGLLLIATAMTHVLFCEALYLRTHKAEPFLWLSFTNALITGAGTVLMAKRFGAAGVCASYLACSTCSLIAGTRIFLKKRRAWHA